MLIKFWAYLGLKFKLNLFFIILGIFFNQSNQHFYIVTNKVFSPVTHLDFGVWGTLGSRGWVGGVMLVLRTFPELVGRSVQNLVEIGPAVWA